MNIKIQGGGSGKYANISSCIGVTNYLSHEDIERLEKGEKIESFFNNKSDNISSQEVTYKIDHNKAKLKNKDAKFFVMTISPSQEEINTMGNTPEQRERNFKDYINKVLMEKYAEGFNKGLKADDIMYFGKVHHTRGDKGGEQMHAHIIISRKDINNKMQISPMTNHKNTSKGAVKGGFNRSDFYKKSESSFDKMFCYKRDFKKSFTYLNTLKNGSLAEINKLPIMQVAFEIAQQQILKGFNKIKVTKVFEKSLGR